MIPYPQLSRDGKVTYLRNKLVTYVVHDHISEEIKVTAYQISHSGRELQ